MARRLVGAVRHGETGPRLSAPAEGSHAVDRGTVEMGRLRARHGTGSEASRRGRNMTSLFRKMRWWLERRRKEEELREELQFHLTVEIEERRAQGLSEREAVSAARRDLGNTAIVHEDARAVWSWTLVE